MVNTELSAAPLLFPMWVELRRPEYGHGLAIVSEGDGIGTGKTVLGFSVHW